MTARTHPRDGKQVPEVEECVEIFGTLSEGEFHHVHQLIAEPSSRYKGWSKHYVFGELTSEQADALCTYLRELDSPHDRETIRRWTP